MILCVSSLARPKSFTIECLIPKGNGGGNPKGTVVSSQPNAFVVPSEHNEIIQLLLAGNYAQSERLIIPLIRQNPNDKELLQMMNLIHIMRDRPYLVTELPPEDDTSSNPIADLLHLATHKATKDKNWKNTIQKMEDTFPNSPIIAHLEVMYIQHNNGEKKALEAVENMIVQHPESTALLLEKGKLLYLNQKYELAINVLNQVHKRDSHSTQAIQILADIAAQKDDASTRISMLMMAMDDNNNVFEQSYFLEHHAIGLRSVGKIQESIKTAILYHSVKTSSTILFSLVLIKICKRNIC